jgi:hypothetical protein
MALEVFLCLFEALRDSTAGFLDGPALGIVDHLAVRRPAADRGGLLCGCLGFALGERVAFDHGNGLPFVVGREDYPCDRRVTGRLPLP